MSVNEPLTPTASTGTSVPTDGAAELDLVDLRDEPDDELLVAIHDGLYSRSFPHVEEREDLESLRSALWGDGRDDSPRSHFVVARSPGAPKAALGFVGCEYYPASSCGLITYLAVDAAARRRHVGSTLVDRAIETLRADAKAAGAELAAVLAEIHDPAKVPAEKDVIPPIDRARMMASRGAKRIPIAYVQPELAPGRARARTLMLVAFPTDGRELDELPASVVREFLAELYASLGVSSPRQDVDLVRSLVGLREDVVQLEPLVPVEHPRLPEAAEYGIGFHLPVLRREPTRRPKGSEMELRSFEEDILAYAYRDKPPFTTRAVDPGRWARIAIQFAGEVTFVSEGRRVSLQCSDGPEGRKRHFLLRASRTDFEETSDLSILHLVLGPDPGSTDSDLNEYDLLKLMKLWQGGEGLELDGTDAAGERFVHFCGPRGELTLVELARAVFDEDIADDAPRVGTVQVLHPICRHGLCQEIVEIRDREGGAEPSEAVIAVGGLVQGLLDFEQIDADELADVFKDVEIEEELVSTFHKGTLLVVSASDRAFSAEHVRLSIGLSPYLLVPHAVLLHNEWWLKNALDLLEDAGKPGRHKLGRLESARPDVSKTLSQRLVPNVLHYPEERALYDTGRTSRALDRREEAVQARLDAVTEEIAARHERIRSAVARSIPLLALIFTWSDALARHDNTIVFAVLVPITLLTLATIALLFWRDEYN